MDTQPEASSLAPVNPGTAGSIRQLPPHVGATGMGGSTGASTAAVQALDNIARRGGRIGTARGGPPVGMNQTAMLGRNLPAHDEDSC